MEWKEGPVISAEHHTIRIKNASGRSFSVEYEEIIIFPSSDLETSIMEDNTESAAVPNEMKTRGPRVEDHRTAEQEKDQLMTSSSLTATLNPRILPRSQTSTHL